MENDWINEAEGQIKQAEDENRRSVEKAEQIRKIATYHWDVLKERLINDISKLNSSEKILKKIGGKIEFSDRGWDGYRISKTTYPAIYLSVTLGLTDIKVDKKIVNVVDPRRFGPQGAETRSEDFEEILKIFIDQENLFLKNSDQAIIPFEELSRYLLEPMIVPHTVFPNFPFGELETEAEDEYDEDGHWYS
jgi:hypothetical protein